MGLSSKDRAFNTKKVSYLDFKQLEMDRVLTALFARLAHNGFPSRLKRRFELSVEAFVDEFLEHPEWFTGFAQHREILERWVETHLMDVVNRGKASQAVAAPRPLHGFTYRFRNPKHSRDYGAAQHLYETLYHARKGAGQAAIEQLNRFFFQGHDKVTGRTDGATVLDVETQALLRLTEQVEDAPDTRSGRDSFTPMCIGAADLLAEDIKRLLFYDRHIPRSVMVDYLKVLLAFHLALYHLRLFKLLPAQVKRRGADSICAPSACPMDPRSADNPHGDCPYRVGVFVDVAGQPEMPAARLAVRSADVQYRRIPSFVKAYFTFKKLDEFGESLVKTGKLHRPKSEELGVADVLQLLEPLHKDERAKFFGARVYALVQDSAGNTETDLDPELKAVLDLKLSEFETYIEMLVALRGKFHRQYITECIDSLLMKNRPGALITQGRTKGAPRRFVLDSRLLEVLLQIAVLRQDTPSGPFYTGELRIEALLTWLRERYGLHIDRLPRGDGFGAPSIEDRAALRENTAAFTARLREVGFYRDLSDAYVSQTVTPRYRIEPPTGGNGGTP
ncbi:methylation-associated defense system protein MAD7 [Gemmatimonas sp. UBA7669]|uniref:methylation-associated defense system protein MAD7 n=1 Tax=Gemmatimonas sp. UBA7669 TaxID=1946568 RepID=UPI0025BEFE1C|nr:hypothetical protein [Gemmatimonas sp. UBA7669]